MANDSCPIRSQLSLVLMRSQVLICPNVDPQSKGFPLRIQFSCYFKGQNQAGAGIGMNGTRPLHIIPFFLSIILFSNSRNNPLLFLLLFFSFCNSSHTRTQLIVHAVCKYWNYAIPSWLSPTLSKVSMLLCDSYPSIAHYGQLSQVCLHVAVSLNFEPWLGKFNPIIPKLFFFYKRSYYSQRNSQIMCGGLNGTIEGLCSIDQVHFQLFCK